MSVAADQRAGVVACVCLPAGDGDDGGAANGRVVAWLSVGAAASVLSQVLSYGFLPLAGAMLAPEPALATVPFAALLIGAVAATFPAAILRDAFGRRAAFALGASLGIAGGLVAAWALLHGAFVPLILGAFWLGLASGFALQYRHAAAASARRAELARSVAIVIGAGALVGIAAPTLAGLFEPGFTPVLGVGTALLAALAHIVALGAAFALPTEAPAAEPSQAAAETPVENSWLVPTAIAAAAWFAMTAVMAYAPLGLETCGIAFGGIAGAVAWHVVAMYAPALGVAALVKRIAALPTAVLGLTLAGGGGVAALTIADAGAIVAALIVVGVGWSLATSGAVIALHLGRPSRLMLAGHDAAILAAAVAGALMAGRIAF